MSFTDWLLWLSGILLLGYVAFVLYKILHELRHGKKPYVALSELSWQKNPPALAEEPVQEVVLVGDFGNVAAAGNDCVLLSLHNYLSGTQPNTVVAFLGDNVYPIGLPPEGHRHRPRSEKRLDRQIELFNNKNLRPVFISGNHDWNKGRAGGLEQVLRQEAYINQKLPNAYLPAGGCPGPVLVNDLNPELALIAINTQWWVQRGERPEGGKNGCSAETEEDFFSQLKKLIEENQHRHILITAHHPLFSNALHGGKHSYKHHVFPLTAAHKKLFVPVPLLGSLYPLYRRIFGAYEDMAHPRYKHMRRKLLKLFGNYNNLVYAAGHDHNLQHFRIKTNHFIVSGAASKTTYVRKGGKASFTHKHLGYFAIRYYSNGQAWLTALEPDLTKKDGTTSIVYQTRLYG